LNYTHQVALDESDRFTQGSDLPGRPRDELFARAQLARRWGTPFYELTWIGPYFVDAAASALDAAGFDAGSLTIPQPYLHTAGSAGTASPRWQYTVEVDNIGDVRTVDLVRYPLPGRVVQAKLRVTIP